MMEIICDIIEGQEELPSIEDQLFNRIITFFVYWSPPFINHKYGHMNENMICGPFIAFIKEMSIKHNYSLIRVKMMKLNDYMDSKASIYLYPITQSIVERMNDNFGKVIFKMSRNFGLISEGHILSVVKPGKRNIREFFSRYDPYVWITILLTLLIFSSLMALIKRSFKAFSQNFWLFTSFILSEAIPTKLLPEGISERIIFCFWMIFSTVFLIVFSGDLFEFFVQNIPNEVIDSWDELYMQKEFRIFTPEISFFMRFVEEYENSDNDMARDFKSRIDHKFKIALIESEMPSIIENITLSDRVFLGQQFQLEAIKTEYNKRFNKLIHVSKYGGGISPYFLALNTRVNFQLETHINILISKLIENGIYDHWIVISLRIDNGISSDKEMIETINNSLTLTKTIEIFNLWIFVILVSPIVLVLEAFHYYFRLKCLYSKNNVMTE